LERSFAPGPGRVAVISESLESGKDFMPEVISLKSRVVASKENVSCSLGDEAAILNMKSGVYYGLDPVGARVWSLLGEPHTVEELREAITSEYDVEPARCEGDLLSLLEKLRTEGLIEIRGE
jgi:hypothetical protein